MKIYIDFLKNCITKVVNENIYQGDIFSDVFELLFYNYPNTEWFPTMSQLAPNGRTAGDFAADPLGQGETREYVEDEVTYLKFDFTFGDAWVRIRGRSDFFIWVNKVSPLFRKCMGKINVMINTSTDNYFISDPLFNPAVKEYIDTVNDEFKEEVNDMLENLGDGSPKYFDTAAHITASTTDKGLAVATDTGYLYYWNLEVGAPNKYTNSGVLYNDLSDYYTKSEADALFDEKADKSTTYTKTEADALFNTKADKSNTYTKTQVDNMVDGLYVSKMYGNVGMSVSEYNGELVLDSTVKNRYVDPTWYHLQVGDKIVFNGNTDYRYWLAIKDDLSDSTIQTWDGWKQETYVANAEVYVRITLAKTDNSNISINFAELLGEDVITIHTRKPVTVRIGTVYGTNLNSYLYYSGTDTFNHRLRTSVIKFNKGDIINFKEFGTKYEWDFMAWDLDGTFISETLWKDGNVYVVQQDCQAVIVFKKSGYDKSLMLKGNIYFKKDLDGTDSATKSVIVLDNTCVKTGETITISNTSNALLYKIDFLSDEWGQGTTSLQTIDYGTSSATVTADMSNVKNVVITMKKTDGTSFSNIASEILWNIYRQDNITSSLGDKYDVDSIYNVDFEVNGTFETNTFNSNVVQCGHRGWDTLAPENTIPSYELAYKLGCRFIEGDVRWTSDGVPVLMHDATINRTARNTDGTTLGSTINIADITYAEALEYDYGIYQGALYKGTKLPTFDEVMKWCKTRDVYFQIDTTTGDWNETQMMSLFKIVKKYGMLDHVLWESLYASKLRTLYALGVNPKNSKMSFYGGITTSNIDTAYDLGCKIVSIQYSLATYSLIQYAISKGIKPFIWFDDLDKNAYNVFRLFNLGTIGFYNTKITDIYALRWFKSLIGYDDNSQSAVTNKEEELLQQAYSDISDLLSDVSTLEQDNAKLKMEVANLKTAVEGNLYNETDANGLAYEVSLSNPLPYGKVNKIGGMSYKCTNLWNNATVLEIGAIGGSGNDTELNTRIRVKQTSKIYLTAGTYSVGFSGLDEYIWYGYINSDDVNSAYNSNGSWQNNGSSFTLTNDCYVRFAFRYSDNRTISNVTELSNIVLASGNVAFTGIRDTAVSQLTISANLLKTTIESGAFDNANGSKSSNNKRIRTAEKTSLTAGTYTISFSGVNSVAVYIFDANDVYKPDDSILSWQDTNSFTFTISYDFKVNFLWRKTTNDVITPSDMTSVLLNRGSTIKPNVVFSIPSQIKALTGYGWGISESVCNYIDYDRKVFVQKVARVDLGTLSWAYNSTVGRFGATNFTTYKKPANNNTAIVGLSSMYDVTSWNDLVNNNTDMNIACLSSDNNIIIRNTSYTDATAFTSAMSGVYLYYELATPVETDISAYLTGDDFDVLPNLEPNGSIVLDNSYEQEAMYDITTLEKVSV